MVSPEAFVRVKRPLKNVKSARTQCDCSSINDLFERGSRLRQHPFGSTVRTPSSTCRLSGIAGAESYLSTRLLTADYGRPRISRPLTSEVAAAVRLGVRQLRR